MSIFEPIFNAAMAMQVVFQQPASQFSVRTLAVFSFLVSLIYS